MSNLKDKVFFDSHCHLFNMEDIPLYPALCDAVNDLFDIPVMGIGVFRLFGGGIAALNADRAIIDSMLYNYSNSILFFNRSIDGNALKLCREIRDSGHSEKIIILTPLIMDFESVLPPDGFTTPEDLPRKTVERQLERLLDGIARAGRSADGKKLLILPFTGLDLCKIQSPDFLAKYKKCWGGIIQSRNPGKIANGTVIGIKIYPPISDNPFPESETNKAEYIKFFNWCSKKSIPITAHCQTGSFNIISQKAMNLKTHPVNWLRLMDESSKLSQLRLNLAHFGGEKSMIEFVDDYKDKMNDENFSKYVFNIKQQPEKIESWTPVIIYMVKKYPNVFTDIAAFDFKPESCDALKTIMRWDNEGVFDRGNPDEDCFSFKLRDKLLWGSDVPMIISDASFRENGEDKGATSYKYLYEKFVDLCCNSDGSPGEAWLYNMTSTNPARFLFGDDAAVRLGLN